MKTRCNELSALLDGELESHERPSILKAATAEGELRTAWQTYTLIGDVLRDEYAGAPDLTARVMEQVRIEPVVLAPRNLPLPQRNHPFLALAASVAGVAVVGWLALANNSGDVPSAGNHLARVAPQVQVAPVAASVPVQGDMSEYLLAHHTQASTFRLGDNTEHIRTVSTVSMNNNRP
jgi:sigma-E factor negative regulatory protein RseA